MSVREECRALWSVLLFSLAGCGSAVAPLALPAGRPPVHTFYLSDEIEATAYQLPSPGLPPRTTIGVRLTNRGATTAHVEYGACSVVVWLYRAEAGGQGPAWQFPAAGLACIDIAYTKTLAPGASFDVAGAALPPSAIGAEPASGDYLVRVAIRRRPTPGLDGTLVVLDGGRVILP